MKSDSCHWARQLGRLYCSDCPFPDCLEHISEPNAREKQAIYYVAEFKKQPVCPKCGSSSLQKNGSRNGIQRYRCNRCISYFKNDGCDLHEHYPRLHHSIAIELRNEGLIVPEIIDRLYNITGSIYSSSTIYGWLDKVGLRTREYRPRKAIMV